VVTDSADPKGTGKLITQYDMYSITDEYGGVGLLKFDFLGIRNLAVLADSVARVKETRGIFIDIETFASTTKRLSRCSHAVRLKARSS